MVDAKMLKTWLDNGEAVLVDVREPVEHTAENVVGAALLLLGGICVSALPPHLMAKMPWNQSIS